MAKKIYRNDPCPCGSGKKYKNCCLNKMNDEKAELLYKEMYQLVSSGNSIKNDFPRIIYLGNTLIEQDKPYHFLSGVHVNLAQAYFVRNQLDEQSHDLTSALTHCETALEIKNANWMAKALLCAIYLRLGRFESAHSLIDMIYTPSPSDSYNLRLCVNIQNEYHFALQRNKIRETDEIVSWKSIIEKLVIKLNEADAVCGLALEFYVMTGIDPIRGYELGRNLIKKVSTEYTIYSNLGMICLMQSVDKPEEAIKYFEKAIELSESQNLPQELAEGLQNNLLIANLRNGNLDAARIIAQELESSSQMNMFFSNYAELLKRQEEYDLALQWARKALFLTEDDTTTLIVADIYRRMGDFDNAIEYYKKCLIILEKKHHMFSFEDGNGMQILSVASNESINMIYYNLFKDLILLYQKNGQLESAAVYLSFAEQVLPGKSEWEIWKEILPKMESLQTQLASIREELEEKISDNQLQRDAFRHWAQQLLLLQNGSSDLNMDNEHDWHEFEVKMDQIIDEMSRIVNRDSILFIETQNQINEDYPNLNERSKEFLLTAEVLYKLHKDSTIDFAPIILEYCKVLENQLRDRLGTLLPANRHMLGQIIGEIDQHNYMPYYTDISFYRAINEKRRSSAHTGRLDRHDADDIKTIFFEGNLLSRL